MRRTVIAIASALLVLAAASCKKDTEKNEYSDRPVRFTATMEGSQDVKTQLVGHDLKWQNGDMVAVVCPEFGTKEMYTPNAAGSTHAEFVYAGNMDDEPTLSTPITAAYPADYWSDDLGTITLSCHQNYVADGMEKFPMYGVGEEGRYGVDFKNVCGVLRVRLVKPGENVTKIAVTSTTYLNGTFGVSMNSEGLPEMEHVSGGTNGDTLLCAEPVSINTATDFYIYLPAGSYNPLRIEIFNDRGLLCSMESTVAINIERNKITTIAPPADKLNFQTCTGLITVNSDGDQVRFAQGNLIYVNGEWKIAEHEYDIYKQNGVDQFHWSIASNNFGLGTESDNSADFVDWGVNIGDNYRTLSADEWNFVIQETGSVRAQRYGRATITVGSDTYIGYIILPDSQYPVTPSLNPGTGFDRNVFTYEAWRPLQAQGVAFLPIAKNPANGSGMWQYWTSTTDTDNSARALTQNVGASANSNGSYYKFSDHKPVRLAQPYEPLVISGSSSTGLK